MDVFKFPHDQQLVVELELRFCSSFLHNDYLVLFDIRCDFVSCVRVNP